MHERPDPLWDPSLSPEAEPDLAHWQQQLATFAAGRRDALREMRHAPALSNTPHVRRAGRRWRRLVAAGAVAAAFALALVGVHHYRLDWSEGRAWSGVRERNGITRATRLVPGERFSTSAHERARLAVARIGDVQLSPDSEIDLLATRRGHHRVALRHGRLQARIWAPPGSFGIVSGQAQVVDLGCEFILQRERDGRGRLQVLSGWVLHEVARDEVLVPAGYAIDFDARHASLPLRVDVAPQLARLALALDAQPRAEVLSDTAHDLARELAATASDDDAYTLLQLLQRAPPLVDTPLYPRLADALGVDTIDPVHRARWRHGDVSAFNEWWQLMPVPPKQWWRHWRDAL